MREERYATREEWLEARRRGIGGSDAAVLAGVSRWSSPLELWTKKVGLAPKEEEGDAPLRLRLGSMLEPTVAELLAEEAGVEVTRCVHMIVRHNIHDYLAYSPDGWVFEKDGTMCLAELKTADSSKMEEWEAGVPEDYVVQVQHGMGVSGVPRAYIGCLIGTRAFRWARIERDDRFIDHLQGKCAEFWRLVTEETPPEPTGADGDARALSRIFPGEEPGKRIALPGDAIDWTEELAAIREQKKELDGRESILKNFIRAAIGDAEVGLLPGSMGGWKWKLESRKEHTVKASESRVLRQIKGR